MTADNQVGFLVPLNPSNLEEQKDSSIPKISLAEGINYVGRNCIPVIDKRLSRKHLTLNISANGSAEILVEGTNPVVVRARNERKKLLSGEKCTIGNGDVLEMIPGHYLFKYLIAKNMESSSKQKRPLNKESNSSKDQAYSSKKTRNICEDTLVRKHLLLISFLFECLQWPEFTANIPSLGSVTINSSFFKKFNYSSAVVRLIASVPGYHSGSNLKKWGHMKLRTVLQECTFEKEFHMSPLVCQFSSLGSLDEKWMAELTASMSAGVTEEKKPLGLGKPLIIWPTVEDVRCSLEGYAAGNAIPSPVKNVEKEFLKKYWAKWKASHTGRCHAMPHIKTFTRYNGQNLAWFLLTSANLSKAAWGALQKNSSQLMIRSYELGVLFLPFSGNHCCEFSCTYNGNHSEAKSESSRRSEVKRTKLVTLAWKGNRNAESTEVIQLPIPYELPPKLYSSEDVPWSWDRQYTQTDVYGQVWPRQVQLYTCQDS
ncbi:tyrosyl-DNA phosphodiesterase 1-like [Olea europaea var. sylvestris]|uniref:tyrosyl-DNA phosphodiesterase 1-like n=1 Tax=Olea europaea var. sylvestris TaxID=158386 RepID=UPI000C1D89D5|nr:tyrosyl-DNA phosphodiesterase 1-like [Olea europaea var. sylvestris]